MLAKQVLYQNALECLAVLQHLPEAVPSVISPLTEASWRQGSGCS